MVRADAREIRSASTSSSIPCSRATACIDSTASRTSSPGRWGTGWIETCPAWTAATSTRSPMSRSMRRAERRMTSAIERTASAVGPEATTLRRCAPTVIADSGVRRSCETTARICSPRARLAPRCVQELRVLDRERRAPRQLDADRDGALVEAPPRGRHPERERADDPARAAQRDAEVGAHAEALEELPPRLAARDALREVVACVRHELRHALAQDATDPPGRVEVDRVPVQDLARELALGGIGHVQGDAPQPATRLEEDEHAHIREIGDGELRNTLEPPRELGLRGELSLTRARSVSSRARASAEARARRSATPPAARVLIASHSRTSSGASSSERVEPISATPMNWSPCRSGTPYRARTPQRLIAGSRTSGSVAASRSSTGRPSAATFPAKPSSTCSDGGSPRPPTAHGGADDEAIALAQQDGRDVRGPCGREERIQEPLEELLHGTGLERGAAERVDGGEEPRSLLRRAPRRLGDGLVEHALQRRERLDCERAGVGPDPHHAAAERRELREHRLHVHALRRPIAGVLGGIAARAAGELRGHSIQDGGDVVPQRGAVERAHARERAHGDLPRVHDVVPTSLQQLPRGGR